MRKNSKKIILKLVPEELKKIKIIKKSLRIPSLELAIRKIIESYSINPNTR